MHLSTAARFSDVVVHRQVSVPPRWLGVAQDCGVPAPALKASFAGIYPVEDAARAALATKQSIGQMRAK